MARSTSSKARASCAGSVGTRASGGQRAWASRRRSPVPTPSLPGGQGGRHHPVGGHDGHRGVGLRRRQIGRGHRPVRAVDDDQPGRGEPRPSRRRRGARREAEGRSGAGASAGHLAARVQRAEGDDDLAAPPVAGCSAGRRLGRRLLQADLALGIRQPEPAVRDRAGRPRPVTSTGRHRARRCPHPRPNPCQTGAEPATTRSGWNGPAAPTRHHHRPPLPQAGLEAAGVGLPAPRRHLEPARHRPRRARPPPRGPLRPGSGHRPGGAARATTPSSPAAASPRPRTPMAATHDPAVVHPASRARASEVAPGPWIRVTVPRRRPGSGSNASKAGRTGSTCSRASTSGCDRRPTPSPGRPGLGASLRCRRPRHGPSVANRCSTRKGRAASAPSCRPV